MINVSCRENKILYSAYHLVKAFWPDAPVQSSVTETQESAIIVTGLEDISQQDLQETSIENDMIRADDVSSLYVQLRDRTGRELPWGMLTGVRPVKLATQWIAAHLPESRISGDSPKGEADAAKEMETPRAAFAEWFRRERFVSREKADVAFQIAVKERTILSSMKEYLDSADGYSLYIGIPFCPSICSYCSFSSGSITRYAGKVDAYLDALFQEMEQKAETYMFKNGRVPEHRIYPTTIYIGGGTPTSLDERQLEKLLDKVEQLFFVQEGTRLGKIREYTVEAGRADSITAEKLAVMKAHGVSRISINPQTMQQKTLDAVGRRHTVEDVKAAMLLAREMGFDNINMDLIMGLAGETNEDVRDTLRQIRELAPESLTIHSLAVKRSSAIGIARKKQKNNSKTCGSAENVKLQQMQKPDSLQPETKAADAAADIAEMIADGYLCACQMGMEPYYLYRQKSIAGNFENTGYALPGKEGLYNILIMEEVQSIIACGAGASTKLLMQEKAPNPERNGQNTLLVRSENVKDIDEYIKRYRKTEE